LETAKAIAGRDTSQNVGVWHFLALFFFENVSCQIPWAHCQDQDGLLKLGPNRNGLLKSDLNQDGSLKLDHNQDGSLKLDPNRDGSLKLGSDCTISSVECEPATHNHLAHHHCDRSAMPPANHLTTFLDCWPCKHNTFSPTAHHVITRAQHCHFDTSVIETHWGHHGHWNVICACDCTQWL
jgi:hypothetical protein